MFNPKAVLSVEPHESARFPAPLFKCLEDSSEAERYINESELKESIEQEINNLISSKNYNLSTSFETSLNQNEALFPFKYGISSEGICNDKRIISDFCEYLQGVIGYYEPRLTSPKVRFQSFDNNRQVLYLEICGNIRVNSVFKPVFFPITLSVN